MPALSSVMAAILDLMVANFLLSHACGSRKRKISMPNPTANGHPTTCHPSPRIAHDCSGAHRMFDKNSDARRNHSTSFVAMLTIRPAEDAPRVGTFSLPSEGLVLDYSATDTDLRRRDLS